MTFVLTHRKSDYLPKAQIWVWEISPYTDYTTKSKKGLKLVLAFRSSWQSASVEFWVEKPEIERVKRGKEKKFSSREVYCEVKGSRKEVTSNNKWENQLLNGIAKDLLVGEAATWSVQEIFQEHFSSNIQQLYRLRKYTKGFNLVDDFSGTLLSTAIDCDCNHETTDDSIYVIREFVEAFITPKELASAACKEMDSNAVFRDAIDAIKQSAGEYAEGCMECSDSSCNCPQIRNQLTQVVQNGLPELAQVHAAIGAAAITGFNFSSLRAAKLATNNPKFCAELYAVLGTGPLTVLMQDKQNIKVRKTIRKLLVKYKKDEKLLISQDATY